MFLVFTSLFCPDYSPSMLTIDDVQSLEDACEAWRRRQQESSASSSDDSYSNAELPQDDRDYVGDTSEDAYYIEHGITRRQQVMQETSAMCIREQQEVPYQADLSGNLDDSQEEAKNQLANEIEERRQDALRRLLLKYPYLKSESQISFVNQIKIEQNRQAALLRLLIRQRGYACAFNHS
jgi:hypothetical protein